MALDVGKRVDIVVRPGTNPIPDATQAETLYYTATDKVRFRNGKLRKIGGCMAAEDSGSIGVKGAARSAYGYVSGNKARLIIGTNTRFLSYQDGQTYNITPLLTSTTAIANSLATNYTTLGNDPFTTVSGSTTVTVAHTAHKLTPGDTATLSGVSGFNGIPAGNFNATQIVRSVPNANSYTISVATAANADGSGGGASVIEATAIITVMAASHGLSDGDRVKLNSASNTGGIPNAEINAEHIIRGAATSTFDIVASTAATSSVSSAGGASTTYQKPITKGAINTSLGFGYGGGLYGAGIYGVGKAFVETFSYPRIWSHERFGNDLISSPGGGGGVYLWQNSTTTAPAALTNAPTQVNWIFVSHNIVMTLGAGGVGNRIKGSDVGDATNWTVGPDSYAYQDDIEGIGTLISQARAKDIDLIYTEQEVLVLRFVDKPDIWRVEDLMANDGIIAPKARTRINDMVFWMGRYDFYSYDGYTASPLPNNTVREYIFDNLNYTQRWKIFAEPNPASDEVIFWVPLGEENEPKTYIIYNYKEQHFTLGSWPRTAAEEPTHLIAATPYLINATSESVAGKIYKHELGVNDDTVALSAYAETNYVQIGEGDNTMDIVRIVPDSTQTGNVNLTVKTKLYQQSQTERSFGPFTVTPATEKVDFRANGRQRKYRFEQGDVDADFIVGKWYETVQEGTPR